LRDGVGAYARVRLFYRPCRLRFRDLVDGLDAERVDSARIRLAVGREHKAGREQAENREQFGEILREQRIRGRDRRVRYAGVHRTEVQQPVLDVVAREHHQRPLRRKLAIEQRLPYPPGVLEGVAVRKLAPACTGALREERALWRALRPIAQALYEMLRIWLQRVRRAQVDDATGAAFDFYLARPEAHGTHRSFHHAKW